MVDDEEIGQNLNYDDGQKARKKQEKPKKQTSQVQVTYDKSLPSAHSVCMLISCITSFFLYIRFLV